CAAYVRQHPFASCALRDDDQCGLAESDLTEERDESPIRRPDRAELSRWCDSQTGWRLHPDLLDVNVAVLPPGILAPCKRHLRTVRTETRRVLRSGICGQRYWHECGLRLTRFRSCEPDSSSRQGQERYRSDHPEELQMAPS